MIISTSGYDYEHRDEGVCIVSLTVIEANSAYVYVAERGDGTLKVGISADPLARARGLQSLLGQSMRVLGVSAGSGAWVGFRLERGAHGMLSQDRLHGEWFSPSPRTARLLLAFGGRLDTDGLTATDAAVLAAISEGRVRVTDADAPAALMPPDALAYWGDWAYLL
jgi:hypothetical protein